MVPGTYVKQVWEERYCVFDLDDSLITGDTIDSIDSVTVWEGSTDKSSTMVGATAIDSGGRKVTAIIKGGEAGKVYWVRVRVIAASGDKPEDDLKLYVKALGA